MPTQLTILDELQAIEARDAGINQAITNADEKHPGWSNEAFELLKQFLQNHSGQFQCEEIRAYAAVVDFPLPPSNRAWGGVVRRAANEGLIKCVGIGPVRNPRAHMANANVYVKAA